MNLSNVTSQAVDAGDPVPSLQLPLTLVVGVLLVSVVIFFVGVVGNVLVLVVILRNLDMQHSTNLGLASLSVADLLVLMICMPTALVEFYGKDVWYFGKVMCKLVPFLENSAAHASALTICAISIERFYAINWPLKARMVCTYRGTAKIIMMLWTMAATCTIPIALITVYEHADFYDGSQVPVCRTHITLPWHQGYIFVLLGVFFVIPSLLLAAVYTGLGRKLFDQTLASRSLSNGTSSGLLSLRMRKQIVLMLSVITAMFFICLLPFKVLSIWHIYATVAHFHSLGFERYQYIMAFARSMYYLNSAINPVVYSLISMRFRRYFRRAIGCGRDMNNVHGWTNDSHMQSHIVLRRPERSQSNSSSRSVPHADRPKVREVMVSSVDKGALYN